MLRFGTVGELRIARVSPGLTWRAFDGAETVGEVRAFLKPNNWWTIGFDACRDDAYQPLKAPGLNPFRYVYPGVNNPSSYDLWVQLVIGGKTNLVCNWSRQVQINSPLP